MGASVKMGICTNKPGLTTLPVLKSLELDQYFSAIITEDDVSYRKPDGRHVLETLNAISPTSTAAIFVGDSETDMAAAEDAGIPAICVTYGYCHVPYKDLKAEAFIDSFKQLPEAVIAINSSG